MKYLCRVNLMLFNKCCQPGDNVLTALSVARDCGIIPPGQRVITVNTTSPAHGSSPQLYYIQSQQHVTSPTDTLVQLPHLVVFNGPLASD